MQLDHAATASSPIPEVLNPHSLWKQLTGIVIASLIAVPFVGVFLPLAGLLTFLDAWNLGIYKKPGSESFVNISPMSWGICMMGIFIVGYPLYLTNRKKLKTKDGPVVYWVLTNVCVGLAVLILVLRYSAGPTP